MSSNSSMVSSILASVAVSAITVLAVTHHFATQISELKKLRQSERTGRINAEKKLRKLDLQLSTSSSSTSPSCPQPNTLSLKQIGTIHSPFVKRMGTPRQGQLVPSARGYIKFDSATCPLENLTSITQFSHVWVLFSFHENTNLSSSLKTMIKPPRANGAKVGSLSTRSPHRPNNIGLSLVKVERLDTKNKSLYISAFDLCHGTPIFDIKPVVPFDVPVNLTVPEWVTQEDAQKSVIFDSQADVELEEMVKRNNLFPLYGSGDLEESLRSAKRAICEVLAQDPRQSRLRGKEQDKPYNIRFCGVGIDFIVTEGTSRVVRVVKADPSDSLSY